MAAAQRRSDERNLPVRTSTQQNHGVPEWDSIATHHLEKVLLMCDTSVWKASGLRTRLGLRLTWTLGTFSHRLGFAQNVCPPRIPLFGRMFPNRFSRFVRECHLIVVEVKRTDHVSALTSVALAPFK
jgi:hypothetical protein